MHTFHYRYLLVGLLSAFSFTARAQQPSQLLAQALQQYPGEKAVYLDYRQDLTVEIVGDSVQVLARHHYDMLHLDAQTSMYADDRVYSSLFNRLQKVEARTLVPNGRDYRAVKVTDFKSKFETQPGIFYDDTRVTTFSFPVLTPGARTVTDYTVRHPDSRFLQPFFFSSYVPVRHAELTITAPAGVKVEGKLFNTDQVKVQFSKQQKGNTVVYRWAADNLPTPPRDDNGPESSYYRPHLMYYIEEAPVAGQQRKLLSGVPELFSLYSSFITRIDRKNNPALKHTVDSLVVGAKTEEERVRRIFYWVQDNVRYIAFENGLRGFIPHDAGLVYGRRYGDCKDMANLTHDMLQLAGIKSYLTWIGTRDLPYRYSDVATPGVDNHMITTYEARPGQYVFLDATSQHTPFGMPSSMIQGKEALLSIDGKTSKVVSVPVIPKEQNSIADVSTLTLDGTGLRGKGQLTMSGYPKIMQSYALDGLDETNEPRYLKKLLERGNNKFFVDRYTIRNREERDKPLAIDYEYHVQDYVQKLDGEIYVNLNLEQPYANDRIDPAKRRLPRYNEFNHTTHSRTELEIPAGYEVEYLPANAAVQDPVLGFTIRYERAGNKIVQDKEVYINYLLLQPTQFAQWNAVVDKLTAAYRDVVILKRKKA
ncbi:DUF3857 domain-containing protein [Hymenobacter sp. DG25A]|uniref:DUF3857 domain-containing protein n=1 Tax=Hymenobacter sp. DG25A TaxID=1385663 RepID=UPI0006BD7D52|nr:DUF3857 domain-containing protein [Hymenobacter sp. DG25A]ALD20096.1 hypothetical protein AM218_01165 [Hymenobacter sp. DG25A]